MTNKAQTISGLDISIGEIIYVVSCLYSPRMVSITLFYSYIKVFAFSEFYRKTVSLKRVENSSDLINTGPNLRAT